MATKEKEIHETKEDFLERIKGLLSEKGLEVSDLQVNLKEEDVDFFTGFIGKDWYTFGRDMGVDNNIMEHIKKTGENKQERKKKLFEYLVKFYVRYEDIIYGLYNSKNKQDPSINDVLDYLRRKRKYVDSDSSHPLSSTRVPGKRPQRSSSSSSSQRMPRRTPSGTSKESIPWQARYEIRKEYQPPLSKLKPLSELSPETYQNHFYNMLWYEEQEHMRKLKDKCDGKYILFVYTGHNKPPLDLSPDKHSHYGFIEGESFTDDKIEYAIQASDSVVIAGKDGSRICTAYKHQHNFRCLKNLMYFRFQKNDSFLSALQKKCRKINDTRYEIHAKFEVKHSYFNHLHDAVVNVPDYIKTCLIPDKDSFYPLVPSFSPSQSFDFMKLDDDKQSLALSMIISMPFQALPDINPPPPVLLYGPFGSGKTRIIARAAYEVMMNGMATRKCTRILICAHHNESIDTFIFTYFGRIRGKMRHRELPFRVILISRIEKNDKNADMYMNIDEFSNNWHEISSIDHLIIITTYSTSLNLHQYFNFPDGFFTHLFLDEAAQVREPEAVTPLAMATRNAKIVLAGDDKQVGPNILVLGEEARKYDLHISLLERMMERYDTLGSGTQNYVTKLSVNYRSHESLMKLPKFFYEDLVINPDRILQQHRGPTGYNFVCSDSKFVQSYYSRDHPLVEACIVLEEVLSYMEDLKRIGVQVHPRSICIISSTRKQLNQIRDMAYAYEVYKEVRKVSFQPSFMIQGHEFEAIFLGLFELVENDDKKAFFIKSLFNPYVFNTVITRAKSRVVAIGKPKEVIEFENRAPKDGQYIKMKFKCWHEYLKLCIQNNTLRHCDSQEELEELMKPTARSTVVTEAPSSVPTSLPVTTITPTLSTNVSSNDSISTGHPLAPVSDSAPIVPKKLELPISRSASIPSVAYSLSSSDDLVFEKVTSQMASYNDNDLTTTSRSTWLSSTQSESIRITTQCSRSSSDQTHTTFSDRHTHHKSIPMEPPARWQCQSSNFDNYSDNNQTQTLLGKIPTSNVFLEQSASSVQMGQASDNDVNQSHTSRAVPKIRSGSNQSWPLFKEQSASIPIEKRIENFQFDIPQGTPFRSEMGLALDNNDSTHTSRTLSLNRNRETIAQGYRSSDSQQTHIPPIPPGEIVPLARYGSGTLVKLQSGSFPVEKMRPSQFKTFQSLSDPQMVDVADHGKNVKKRKPRKRAKNKMKSEMPSQVIKDIITDTLGEKKNVFDEITQLKEDLEHLKEDLTEEMVCNLDDKLQQKCEELTKENEELKEKLRQTAQKTIVDLSNSTIVATLEVSIRSNGPQYVDWKEYGMAIDIPQNVFSAINEVEFITVEALAGGKFDFPIGMNLVSAVYAISVTKPLDEAISLEIEHCVDLTDEDELKYLKFAVAPHSSGPPYKFEYVNGGKFAVGSRYGTINRDEFSLFCIGLEGENPDDDSSSSSDEEQTALQENSDEEDKQEHDDDNHSNEEVIGIEATSCEPEVTQTSSQALMSKKDTPSHGLSDRTKHDMSSKIFYRGQMFHKPKEMIFAAVKQLKVLLKYNCSQNIKEGQAVDFKFTEQHDYIELVFDDDIQKDPTTGWLVKPHLMPCKLFRSNIDEYGSNGLPATCIVSVSADTSKSTTVPTLCYCITLEGVTPHIQLVIIRYLDNSSRPSAAIAPGGEQTLPQRQPALNSEKAKEILKKSFAKIFKLLSDGKNRINLAAELYSQDLITESSLDDATDDSPQGDAKKGMNLTTDIKATITNKPESLITLIEVFEQVEEFQTLAKAMKDDIKKYS